MRATATCLFAHHHWTYQTIEWGRQVASVAHTHLAPSHYILPDLPDDVITPKLVDAFYNATFPNSRIVTIQASRHTNATLEEFVQHHSLLVDKFLIVGGNRKNRTSLSTLEALEMATSLTIENQLWAVANPNDKTSVTSVEDKVEAGASGIITQPLLSSHSMEILQQYPRDNAQVAYVAGLALPKSSKGLLFWLQLLNQPELREDSVFQVHLEYFGSGGNSLQWAKEQLRSLQDADIQGIHYMPLTNTDDLISLLKTSEKQ